MSSSSASAAGRPNLQRLPSLDGRLVIGLAVVLAVALAIVGSRSMVGFVAIFALALALAAVAAHRWPLASLTTASLVTIADLGISRRLVVPDVPLDPIGLSEPLLAVVGLVITANAIAQGRIMWALRDPVLPLTALFVGFSAISAVVNAVPIEVALLGIVMTIDAIAIYFLARMVPAADRRGPLAIGAVVGAIVVAAIFGLGQIIVAPSLFGFAARAGSFQEGARITSVIGNPNMMAALIGLALPFVLVSTRHLPDARWRWVARVAAFVLLLALVWTFSRGGWIAVGLGTTVGLLLVDWRILPVFLLTVVLAYGAAMVAPRNIAIEAGVGGGEGGSGSPSILDSTLDRIDSLSDRNDTRARYIRDGLRIVSANPLFGVGPGRYGGAAATIIPSPVYEEYGATLFGYRTVHNFWLHLVGENGILGTTVFLALVAGLFIRLVRAARRVEGVPRIVLGGAATMILVTSLHNLTEMLYEGNMPALLLWLVLGLASTMAPVTALFGRSGGRDADPAPT